MILHAEHRTRAMAEALDGSVVQIEMRHLDVLGQRRRVDGEAVVLRSDFDLPGLELLHRMIRAAMTEFQLERLAPHREAEDLMTEADAKTGTSDPTSRLALSIAYGRAAGSPGPLLRNTP